MLRSVIECVIYFRTLFYLHKSGFSFGVAQLVPPKISVTFSHIFFVNTMCIPFRKTNPINKGLSLTAKKTLCIQPFSFDIMCELWETVSYTGRFGTGRKRLWPETVRVAPLCLAANTSGSGLTKTQDSGRTWLFGVGFVVVLLCVYPYISLFRKYCSPFVSSDPNLTD